MHMMQWGGAAGVQRAAWAAAQGAGNVGIVLERCKSREKRGGAMRHEKEQGGARGYRKAWR